MNHIVRRTRAFELFASSLLVSSLNALALSLLNRPASWWPGLVTQRGILGWHRLGLPARSLWILLKDQTGLAVMTAHFDPGFTERVDRALRDPAQWSSGFGVCVWRVKATLLNAVAPARALAWQVL